MKMRGEKIEKTDGTVVVVRSGEYIECFANCRSWDRIPKISHLFRNSSFLLLLPEFLPRNVNSNFLTQNFAEGPTTRYPDSHFSILWPKFWHIIARSCEYEGHSKSKLSKIRMGGQVNETARNVRDI